MIIKESELRQLKLAQSVDDFNKLLKALDEDGEIFVVDDARYVHLSLEELEEEIADLGEALAELDKLEGDEIEEEELELDELEAAIADLGAAVDEEVVEEE